MRLGQREFGNTPQVSRRYCDVIDCGRYCMQFLRVTQPSGKVLYLKRCHEHARSYKQTHPKNKVSIIGKAEYLQAAEPWSEKR